MRGSAVAKPGGDGGTWLRVVEVEQQLESGFVTGRAEKQLIDETEKDKGVQDNFRVYAQVVERLELPFRRHRKTRGAGGCLKVSTEQKFRPVGFPRLWECQVSVCLEFKDRD